MSNSQHSICSTHFFQKQCINFGYQLAVGEMVEADGLTRTLRCAGTTAPAFGRIYNRVTILTNAGRPIGASPHTGEADRTPIRIDSGYHTSYLYIIL